MSNIEDWHWEDEPDWERVCEVYELRETDPEQALKEFLLLAENGSAYSMMYIAEIYRDGLGCNIDMNQAALWFRRAAEKGIPIAIIILGRIYLDQKEYTKAYEVFSKGAEKEYLPAMYWLGRMYRDARGVNKQIDKARDLFEAASAAGHVFAKRALAGLFMSGQFGFLNIFRGLFLFFKTMKDVFLIVIKYGVYDERLL